MLSSVLDKALLNDEGRGSAEAEATEADTCDEMVERAKKKKRKVTTRGLCECTQTVKESTRRDGPTRGWRHSRIG
jgi:hypothetical protein